MIKSNPVGVTLVFAFFLSALASAWFAGWWFFSARQLQALESRYQSMTQVSSAVQSLANDALEYSRRHPAIDPLLQEFDLKGKSAASVAPAPTLPPTAPGAANPPRPAR